MRQYRFGFLTTSDIELVELFKAWVAMSVAFGILLLREASAVELIKTFGIAAVTVGTGFLLHELAHKIVAQHYGCFAEFRSDTKMLLFAIFTSLFGFLFAAPGAVMIYGHISKKENGIVSMFGPIMNIVIALLFLVLSLQHPSELYQYGYRINSWLAVFNMLPFSIIDGAKVWRWNKAVYGAVMALAIGVLMLQYAL